MLLVDANHDAAGEEFDPGGDAGLPGRQRGVWNSKAEGAKEIYPWVGDVLQGRSYDRLGKADRGLVKRFLEKITGLSRAQLTRLIGRWQRTGQLQPRGGKRRRFPRTYTDADIRLLAQLDEAHEGLSGPATKRILEREFTVYGKVEYKRLAGISAAHIYNLRRGRCYRQMSSVRTKTQATQVAIGERRKPDPRDRPGWLRVDTVHQGDRSDGAKGIYHLNAVDTVTQWQVVGAVETISEAHLLPVLEAMLHQFPFRIHGVSTPTTAASSSTTKWRRCSTGCWCGPTSPNRVPIAAPTTPWWKARTARSYANTSVTGGSTATAPKQFERFYRRWLNPYLNFHRPCGFAQLTIEPARAPQASLSPAGLRHPLRETAQLGRLGEPSLKQGIRPDQLERRAMEQSDTESAQAMQTAKQKLLTEARSAASLPPGKSA